MSNASGDDPEMTYLLNTFWNAAVHEGELKSYPPTPALEAARVNVDAARKAVEKYVSHLREERDRLRKDNERLNMGDGYQRGVLYALHHNDGTWGVYAIMGSADIWFSQAVTRCNHTSCSNAWKEFYDLPDEVQRLRGGALKEGATQ